MIKDKIDDKNDILQDISTTATVRKTIEAHAEEPVILVVPIGGDASEFE